MNRNTETKVKITDEYNIFTFADGNRSIKEPHVRRLIKSIQTVGLIPAPIIVNEKMEILDGQHRVEACMRLNEPVYYIVINGAGMKEATAMNANNKNWTSEDYLNYYASEGLADYVFVKRMFEKTRIPLSILIRVLVNQTSSGGGSKTEDFFNGTYKIDGDFSSQQEVCEWLSEFKADVQKFRGRRHSMYFTLAWIKRNLQCDDARLKKVIHEMTYEDIGIADMKDVLRLIEARYNKGLSKQNRVYFTHEFEIKK